LPVRWLRSPTYMSTTEPRWSARRRQRASLQRWRLQRRQKERRLARATEAVVVEGASQDEADLVDLSGELGHMARDCPQERVDDPDNPPSPSRFGRIKCHNCAEWGHMARDCASEPSGRRGGARESWRGSYRGGSRGNGQNGGVRVNLVSTDETTQVKTRERGVQYGDGGEQANPNNFNN